MIKKKEMNEQIFILFSRISGFINSAQKLNKPPEKRREIQAGRKNAAAAREFLFFAM